MSKPNYCQVERGEIEERRKRISIGLDLRSEPEDDSLDRVCCKCGESLASDGYCEGCRKGTGKQ